MLVMRTDTPNQICLGLGIAVFLAVCLPPIALAEGLHQYQGEELYYSLEFMGAETARAALVVGDYTDRDGTEVLPIYGLAETTGLAAMVYPMKDEGSTLAAPDTGRPLVKEVILNERGEYRRYEVSYAEDAYRASVTRLREGATSRYDRVLPRTSYDGLSWIFAVRQQDLTPETTSIYYIFDGWKLSRVHVTVSDDIDEIRVGDEYIDCARLTLYREVLSSAPPLPFIHETAILPPSMWIRDTAVGQQVGELWISADDRRLPVQIVFHNDLISATASLASYRPPAAGYAP